MIVKYIPLSPDQKYFTTAVSAEIMKIKPPVVNAALGTILTPEVQLSGPPLETAQNVEVKSPSSGNYVWWILGAMVVIGGGAYWFISMRKKPNQQAPKNIDQVNTEMKALPEKKQEQKEIDSSQISAQVTENTSAAVPVSQQSPPQAPSNLANFPAPPSDASANK